MTAGDAPVPVQQTTLITVAGSLDGRASVPLITGTVRMPSGALFMTVKTGEHGETAVLPGVVSAREHAAHIAQVIDEKEADDRRRRS